MSDIYLDPARKHDAVLLFDVTDGNLSAHVAVLAKAGLVRIDKAFVDNRPRTWVRATKKGRSTFHAEISALRKLVGRYQGDIAAPR